MKVLTHKPKTRASQRFTLNAWSASLLILLSLPVAAESEYAPEKYATEVVVDQEVIGVAPEMLAWWWDNIRSTERYQTWNPDEHLTFTSVVEPDNATNLEYSVGAQQTTTDYIGGFTVISDLIWRDPTLAQNDVSYERHLLSEIVFAGLEGMSDPETGWGLYEYEANAAVDGSIIRTRISLPESVNQVYPGYAVALEEHVQQDMENLAGFLPDLFQEEFVETELRSRGSFTVSRKSALVKTVVVDQEIKGLTPEMIDWWWDNINTTARYKKWHPTAHVSFEWVTPPENPDSLAYSPGAVQEVTEYLGRYKSNLRITWLDPQEVADQVTYSHWLYAGTDLQTLSGIFPQTLIHEYQMNEAGDGVVMRSTFEVPTFLNWVMPGFTTQLGYHAIEEMQFLQYFLPDLYEKEYVNR